MLKICLPGSAPGGAKIWRDGEFIEVTAREPLPPDLIEHIRARKPELLTALADPAEAEAEGAVIAEYHGNVPRSWTDGIARLDAYRPPANVAWRRWQQFIDDSGRFLDSEFAEKAAALGWDALDLFGCNRDRPFDRIDQQGLCWLIAGNRIVDLSEEVSIIETWTGACQTWRRRPSASGRVLPWELIL